MNPTLLDILCGLSVFGIFIFAIAYKIKFDNAKDTIEFLYERVEILQVTRDRYYDKYSKAREENYRLLQYHAGKPVSKDIEDLLKGIEDGN